MGLHGVKIKGLDRGKVCLQFFGWLTSLVEIVSHACSDHKDKGKQNQDAPNLALFFLFTGNGLLIRGI